MSKINNMEGLRSSHISGPQKKKTQENDPLIQKDQVILSGDKGSAPNLIVGAFTGRLGPHIPSDPPEWPIPIGIEIKDGIGIGIDGESIIVSHSPKAGEVKIEGHLDDGMYPQRDFTVKRDGTHTKIDGLYDWQDYTLTQKGNTLEIDGITKREDYQVTTENGKTVVKGDFPVQNFVITQEGNKTIVDGYTDNYINEDYTLTKEGNVTKIKGPFEERDFTITDKGDEITVDGHYAFQDFTIKRQGNQVIIKGHYPQQKYVITFKE